MTGQLLAACREWDARLAESRRRRAVGSGAGHQHGGLVLIQLMIPAVVSAAAFPHIRALAEKAEALPAFQQYPLG